MRSSDSPPRSLTPTKRDAGWLRRARKSGRKVRRPALGFLKRTEGVGSRTGLSYQAITNVEGPVVCSRRSRLGVLMKLETAIIGGVILLLLAFAAIGHLQTVISERDKRISQLEGYVEANEIQIEDLQQQLLPLPYHPPMDYNRVSSGTGFRKDPMGGGTEGLHKGVDLVGPRGAAVRAVLAGEIAANWPAPDDHWRGHPVFGGLVVIDHGEGLFSLYGHLSATLVHEGYQVEAGHVIGRLGDTGITTGPHLHFEVVVDPLRYLEER